MLLGCAAEHGCPAVTTAFTDGDEAPEQTPRVTVKDLRCKSVRLKNVTRFFLMQPHSSTFQRKMQLANCDAGVKINMLGHSTDFRSTLLLVIKQARC